ncbi:beta-2 adrenergic receptor-like [Oculina patagonica]
MYPAKPLFTKVLMTVLTAILTSASVVGNGFVLAVIARFKSLRTVPNILVANLALVDLFDVVINIPSYMIYTVFEASWFSGKVLAFTTTILNRLFLILNLASMLTMMVNMYLAISFDLKYLGWKTNKKALVCALLIWFVSIVTVMLSLIPLLDIDLGDAHVIEYREEIYKQGKHFAASFMASFIICGAIVSFCTIRAIKKKKKKGALRFKANNA